MDPITRKSSWSRDRERLRKMTFYCFTNECLRDYILRYLGNTAAITAGIAPTAWSQFETVDVTDISKAYTHWMCGEQPAEVRNQCG